MGALHSLVIPYQLGWREPHNILYNWIAWKWVSDQRSGFFDTCATDQDQLPCLYLSFYTMYIYYPISCSYMSFLNMFVICEQTWVIYHVYSLCVILIRSRGHEVRSQGDLELGHTELGHIEQLDQTRTLDYE